MKYFNNDTKQREPEPLEALMSILPAIERLEEFTAKKRAEQKLQEYGKLASSMFDTASDEETLLKAYKEYYTKVLGDTSIPTQYKHSILQLGDIYSGLKNQEMKAKEKQQDIKLTEDLLRNSNYIFNYNGKTYKGKELLDELVSGGYSKEKALQLISKIKPLDVSYSIVPTGIDSSKNKLLNIEVRKLYIDPYTKEPVEVEGEKSLVARLKGGRIGSAIKIFDEQGKPYTGALWGDVYKTVNELVREEEAYRDRQETKYAIRFSDPRFVQPFDQEVYVKDGDKYVPYEGLIAYQIGASPYGGDIKLRFIGKGNQETVFYKKEGNNYVPLDLVDVKSMEAVTSSFAKAPDFGSAFVKYADLEINKDPFLGVQEHLIKLNSSDNSKESLESRQTLTFSSDLVNKLKEHGIGHSKKYQDAVTLGDVLTANNIYGKDKKFQKDAYKALIRKFIGFLNNEKVDKELRKEFLVKTANYLSSYIEFLKEKYGDSYDSSAMEELKTSIDKAYVELEKKGKIYSKLSEINNSSDSDTEARTIDIPF
ncbi:MAG: hypothetical protein HPY57_13100 [Ignavibacteria bacterium]|nr:hypothetical protein [Ignavibacteria bacterium]